MFSDVIPEDLIQVAILSDFALEQHVGQCRSLPLFGLDVLQVCV